MPASLRAGAVEMQCRGPHTNMRKGATQFPYGITAIGPSRVTLEPRGCGESRRSRPNVSHGEWPREEAPNTHTHHPHLTPGLQQTHLATDSTAKALILRVCRRVL